MDYKKMTLDDIIAWCKANSQVDWLKSTAKKTFPTEDGGTRKITFIEIKRAFCEVFMPEIMPKAEPKQPTMWDRINAL